MSQRATGTSNVQISVTQSQSVDININGQLAVKQVSPAFPRPPVSGQILEVDLLKAPHASVPFVGRADFLNEFLTWCQGPRPVSFRILTGQGGAGKTRFAYELYGRIRQQTGWGGYFFDFHRDEAKDVNLWDELPTSSSLLIADYAADYVQPLADLLRSLTELGPPADGRRMRILLLARTGDWQQGWLRDLKSGRTGGEVDRLFHPRDPIVFPRLTSDERRRVFQSALERFVELNARQMPEVPDASVFERPDVADRLGNPLTLMMAAATAVHSGSHYALTLNRTDLAFEVAENLVADRMRESVKNHRELFLHMAAFATLCGGLGYGEALAAVESEADATKLGHVGDPEGFLKKLQAWLPPFAKPEQTDWIGSIQPDIVGEAFVLGSKGLGNLRAEEATVLRAHRCRGQATLATVIRAAQDFSLSATNPRTEPVSWVQALIQAAESDQDLLRLAELSNAMPLDSVPLRVPALRAAASLVDKLRPLVIHAEDSGPRSLLASSLNTLSIRQSEVGQRDEALETAREAVTLRRELGGQNRAAFLPDLAGSLNNLANRQSAVGRRDEALETAREAATVYRELAGQNRAAFLPDLAMSLNNLANRQSAVGQRDEALETAREAATVYRELAGQNRAAFLPDLAGSLNNLANRQSEVGQRDEALETAREAVTVCRELAGQNRAAFLPDLAGSLNNLANMQSAVGQRDEAL
ncbi:MAG: tetratricopeptide repeat protein, partial [Acidobacteriaceae bacterium]|nr:tetratricopeptide repeat protein [Acidobacteriaceae bacterium]